MIYQWVVFHFHPSKSQRLSSLWPQSTQKHQSPLFHPNEWREVVCDFNPSTKLVISFIISPSRVEYNKSFKKTLSASWMGLGGFVCFPLRANSLVDFPTDQDASYFVSHKHWWVQVRCKSCPADSIFCWEEFHKVINCLVLNRSPFPHVAHVQPWI